MNKKPLTAVLSLFLILFYCAIIMIVTFPILEINLLDNFVTALTFDIISFCMLLFLVLTNILYKPIKTGYFVPIIICTIVYLVAVDVLNLGLVFVLGKWGFLLLNMLFFFGYSLVTVPMYITGRQ